MNNPTKNDVIASINSRRVEIENITIIISELEQKIKKLNQRKIDLKNLNLLDTVLLKELNYGTN
jgi:transcriptional regulator NrdR family protein